MPIVTLNSELKNLVIETKKIPVEYRYWQIEPLLTQSIELLDKCLARRNMYLEFKIKHFFQQQQFKKDQVTVEAENLKNSVNYNQLKKDISQENSNEAFNNLSAANRVVEMAQQIYNRMPTHEDRQVHDKLIHEAKLSANHWAVQANIAPKNISIVETENEVQEMTFYAFNRDYNEKLSQFTATDGLLNFNKQAEIYCNLLKSDFVDALKRLRAVEGGMLKYYGYDMQLPTDDNLESSLESFIETAYKAIRWLQAFSHKDQATCKVISVRHCVGEGIWQQQTNNIRSGRKLNFNFWIEDKNFDLSHVRLRGISAYIVGDIPIAWTGIVTVPGIANVKYLNGRSELLNQSEIPSCKLGRIESKFSYRIPDVYGSISLSNASPISADKTIDSSWNLDLFVPELDYFNTELEINDIQLELLIMGQPVR